MAREIKASEGLAKILVWKFISYWFLFLDEDPNPKSHIIFEMNPVNGRIDFF